MPPLTHELETYERERERLLAEHAGEFALISGSAVLGAFGSEGDALRSGYQQVGNKPFLVRKIERIDPKVYCSVNAL